MCNLYSLTKGQAAIRDWFRASNDRTGNLPLFPGIFPDQLAPIVRNGADGERELVMARWGCRVRRSSAALRSPIFAMSVASTGAGGLASITVASCQRPRFANTRIRSRARREMVRPQPRPTVVRVRWSMDPMARRARTEERASRWAA